jgi:hypothetical protein
MLTGKKSSWRDERNRMLAIALEMTESETCKGCGTPLWLGHSTDSEIQFKVESTTCYGCAELDKGQKQSGSQKPKPGEQKYVTPYNVWEGKALPSRYDAYREQE